MTTTPQVPAPPTATAGDPGYVTTGQLVTQLTEQVSKLVRDEVALAKLEVGEKGKRLGLGAGMFGVAGVLAVYGLAAALVTAGLALALVFSGWLAALIVTGAIFVLAGLLALTGLKSVKRGVPPVPKAAIASVKQDVAVIKESRHRG
jgi:hypothetical protein